ncbi:MAG: sugar phosphate isomerase/epimerase [Victivallales bacterium]|nr:sugar phosphate isomerase/epimerase [Victivallales bacterium]
MKLSMETFVMRQRLDDAHAIEMLAKAGFDGVDYSFYWTEPETDMLVDGYLEYAEKVRKTLDAAGIFCEQTHAPFNVKADQPWDLDNKHYRDIVRSLEFSAILGAKTCIVHALGRVGEESVHDLNVRYFRSLEPWAEKTGVKIGVENLFERDKFRPCCNPRFGTPESMAALLHVLGNKNFTCCLDVGHAAITGTEPEDFIRRMPKGWITTLHIQDNDHCEDQHLLPYLGKLNWDAVLTELQNYGYSGNFNLEINYYMRKFPTELLQDAANLAQKVGRSLANRF